MNIDLKGIIPPMITPLTEKGELDEKGLERLIEHMISGGVHGIFLLGTNGEAPSLTYELRKELITKACKQIAHRIPVLVGITDTSFQGSLDIAEHAKKSGADAVVIAPPYYYPISDSELKDYFEAIIPKLPLPFLLYNMPSCTKMDISLENVRFAKDMGALGIKDSSGNQEYLYSLIEAFKDSPEFTIIVGTESFLSDTIKHGGHGAVAGGANFLPRLFVDLYNASIENNETVIDELNEKVNFVYDTIYSVGQHSSRVTKGIKCALSVMDICGDEMALPLRKFGNGEREKIRLYIEQLGSIPV